MKITKYKLVLIVLEAFFVLKYFRFPGDVEILVDITFSVITIAVFKSF